MKSTLRAALVIDVQSMYRAVNHVFKGKVVNYLDLVKWLEDTQGLMFVYKLAFGKQAPERAHSFVTLMKANGFDVNISDIYWNTEIGVRSTALLPNVEAIVLCSGYYEHGSVLKYARSQGKLTYVVCPDVPKFFRNHATILEFPISVLRNRRHEPDPAAESVELHSNGGSDGNESEH